MRVIVLAFQTIMSIIIFYSIRGILDYYARIALHKMFV